MGIIEENMIQLASVVDGSYIKGKVMTFWNVKSCGDEWNWYD